jgi:CHAD domain-containing protein
LAKNWGDHSWKGWKTPLGFRIKDAEAVPDAIRRITLDQIDRALDRLELRTRNKDRAVHEARVCFKKIRAVLRLTYGEIGPEIFKLENGVYRDAGRQLAAARDTAVVAGTLEELVHHFDSQLAEPDIKLLRKRLRRLKAHQQIDKDNVLPKVIEELKSARARVEMWPLKSDGFEAVSVGLRRVYKKGRAQFALVRAERTVENLHEWRKQVKYLWYQICVLNPIWPNVLDAFAHELNKLADLLSEDHDLAMLRTRAVRQRELLGDSSEIDELVNLIDSRRVELETKAAMLGARIYAEKPGRFESRFREYWNTWRPPAAVQHPNAEQMTLTAYAVSKQN